MNCKIDHVHIRSADAPAAARFYVDLFQAREIGRIGEPVSRVMLDLGGLTVFIEQAPQLGRGATPPHRGLEHIGLRVENMDDAVARLAAHGIALVSGITVVSDALRIAFFDGPDNVRIELLERR